MRTIATIRPNAVHPDDGGIRIEIECDPKDNGIVIGVCHMYADKVIAAPGSRFWAVDAYLGDTLILVMRCDEVREACVPISELKIWEASEC